MDVKNTVQTDPIKQKFGRGKVNADASIKFEKKKFGSGCELVKNRFLYLMALPGIIFFVIFSYIPLSGLQIAFKSYNVVDGIWRSPFIGFKNFEFYFKSSNALITTFNTLYLNFLFIAVGTIVQVILALMINEVSNKYMKKFYQSVIFLPYFMSWIVISAFMYNLLNHQYGTLNMLMKSWGFDTVAWYNKPEYWRGILTFVNTWQSAGYYVVIYLATIVSIDSELYEASKIDGANKLKEIVYITIPHLLPTIVLLLLIQIGKIFYGNFNMVYAIVQDNGMLLPVTDIIDTYVFRAMRTQGDFGMAAAVGLYQSVMGFILVLVSNKLVKKFDENMGLF